jgi:phosphatidylglycerol---prolipoprotein diacylglyceryl transferase
MFPFIHIPRLFTLHLFGHSLPVGGDIGTFGIMLWLAAVCAWWVLQKNLRRSNLQADAMGIVAVVTVAGIVGAKLWHVMDTPGDHILQREGFAWFGGLVGGILALLWEGRANRIGSLAMLDLAAPAAAVGYGVGRLGCLTSGDGDYGIATNLPWGMSFPNGLVPTLPGVRVHPTPIYELIVALIIAWILWRRGAAKKPVGEVTGEYLVLSGIARFLVEFIRINPKIYWGLSNAQLASLGSIAAGVALIAWARWRATKAVSSPRPPMVQVQP